MDFAQALHQLWTRRGWTTLGLLVAIVVGASTAYDITPFPPSLQQKHLALGTASTAILVDTPRSSVTDLRADLKPLTERAYLFARLATSEAVAERLAKNIGVRRDQLLVEAPIDGAVRPQSQRETRVTSILSQNREFRVNFAAQPGLPNIQVNAQAPRLADALKLADAAAQTFADYIREVQRRQEQPASARVVLRQLGPATGGTIAKEINRSLAVLGFLTAFVAWCVLMIVITGVASNLRAIRESQLARDAAADDAVA